MLDRIAIDDFAPLIGEKFAVEYPDHRDTLTLTEVQRTKTLPPEGLRQGFSLMFESDSRTVVLGQGIHPLSHPHIGRLEVFMVPVGRKPEGSFVYQVAFS